MPFTPYHFGPGLLLKAVCPRRFSTIAYCATQVAIDLEPGYYIFIAREAPVHRGVHTFLGAVLVGLAVGGAVAALGIVERRVAARLPPERRLHRRRGLSLEAPAFRSELSSGAALFGGLFGGLLHIVLDAIMHAHLRPFRPFWSEAGPSGNPFAGAVSVETLYLGCTTAGVIGLLWLLVRPRLWLTPHPPGGDLASEGDRPGAG